MPRAHSKRLGELEASNWKSLRSEHNLAKVDPAIREIVELLNQKGYTTFSSCSGGHHVNSRREFDRHESGYLAFSPPSRVPFIIYRILHRKNRDFGFEAQAVIDDGNGFREETACTRLYWQLLDERKARTEYYTKLFADMKRIISQLPESNEDHKDVLAGLLGREHLASGLSIVRGQMKRFDDS